MDVKFVNEALGRGAVDEPGVLPHHHRLGQDPFVLEFQFGLDTLPEDPDVILVRRARQYGKSTWLEGRVRETVRTYGPGTALYLADQTGDVDFRKGSL